MHKKNKHGGRYDFNTLIAVCEELKTFVKVNEYGDQTIDFSNPDAVKMLNKALLKHFYSIEGWDIPENYLCPPIPGRADYIHYAADLLRESDYGKVPIGTKFKIYDVGVGANCVYPLLGVSEYEWSFIGSDIDAKALENAAEILEKNIKHKENIELRLQRNTKDIFYGVITKEEKVDLTLCNPPFHSSAEEAASVNLKKVNNLSRQKTVNPQRNFGGQDNELWCEGGEERFVRNMIRESKKFADNCFWFTSLISKNSHIKTATKSLEKYSAVEVKVIPMGQGNKSSRILAWTFLSSEQQKEWKNSRWNSKAKKTDEVDSK